MSNVEEGDSFSIIFGEEIGSLDGANGMIVVSDDADIEDNAHKLSEENFGSYELDRTNAKKLELILEVADLITPNPSNLILSSLKDVTAPKARNRSSRRTTARGTSTSSNSASSNISNTTSTNSPSKSISPSQRKVIVKKAKKTLKQRERQ
ncbi:hypothetical protein FJ651_15455 [Paucihalobacter ruber]|uniref:Uncharacterized protein n=1 Tax=Paucihalobacter ruber TaxID=2567861 RepID=A0A506PCA3_9FLAO|nr:hypothetical protein [Paucihalobacter ruber]TPV31158.1 hypothetical protein FJ651_15455 [Paucihalobacter ruber]